MSFVVSNDKFMINVFYFFRIFEIEWLCSISIFRRQNLKNLNLFEIDVHEFQFAKKKIMKKNARTRSTIDSNDRFFYWKRYVVSKIFNKRNFYEQTKINKIVNDCAKFFVFQQKIFVFVRTQFFFTKLRVENENSLQKRKLCASIWFDRDNYDFFQKFKFCNNEKTIKKFDLKTWMKNDFFIFYWIFLYVFFFLQF